MRVEDILISGKEMFVEYTTQRINKELEADIYEGNETIFTGMGISKENNAEFQWLSTGANRYEDKIKSIEISHARMRTLHEPLTEGDLSIARTELGN